MKITIELPEIQSARLRQESARLGVQPADLAHAALTDLWAAHDDDFRATAHRVLRKNEELYRRLA
jgi:hypothetical protein